MLLRKKTWLWKVNQIYKYLKARRNDCHCRFKLSYSLDNLDLRWQFSHLKYQHTWVASWCLCFSRNSDYFGKKLVIQFFYNMQVMYMLGRLLTCCQCSFQADNRLTDTHAKNNMGIRRILVHKIKIQVYRVVKWCICSYSRSSNGK